MPLARVPAWESQILMYTLAVVLASELRTMRGSAAYLKFSARGEAAIATVVLNLVDKV